MMSVERSFEAWEEVQRHGQDLADRLAQGFTGDLADRLAQGFTGMMPHITPPSFQWPNPQPPKLFDMDFPSYNFAQRDFGQAVNGSAIDGVSAIFDIGNRIGQAGWDFGACVNGMVEQVFRRLPLPFRHDNESVGVSMRTQANVQRNDLGISLQEDLGSLAERFREYGFTDNKVIQEDSTDEGKGGVDAKSRLFGGSEGTINFTSTYESRTQTLETTMAARGDLWRVEAKASNVSGSENASLFLVQLGPVLFVRDSTLLLPIHLSKQHLLWYGYDRKHGMHSLCPAMWSKHRRWLLMSMLCLNPMACSFMDLQFPNGQITYVAGEGISTSAFLPLCGGLLQAQGQYPGEMKFSFSCKNKFGTCITPMIQLPDKSFSLGLAQSLAWKRSGLMVRPTVQFSLCPTFGGNNPGVQAELTHSLNEEVSLTCGCSMFDRPTAFTYLSLGRSKWNGNVGTSGVVVKVETPLDARRGRPNLSVQMNSGIEF